MLKNYLKIAFRNILKNKWFSAINILGLAAGLASFIIVLLFLNYELSYDSWDDSLKQVYKLSSKKGLDISETTPAPLATLLMEEHPEITHASIVQSSGDYEVQLDARDKTIFQKGITSVDSNFFDIFPFHFIQGSRENALQEPNTVVISEALAKKLFDDIDPIGESIKIYNALECKIVGVIRLPATPSHLNPHLILRDPFLERNIFWENYSYETYVRTVSPVDQEYLDTTINRLYYDERVDSGSLDFDEYLKSSEYLKFYSDAVPQIHNYPKYGSSNIKTIQSLFLLAILLLVAGAINFSNLTVAKSLGRNKEAGIRKVLGSGRRHIIFQLMIETAVQCIIGLVLAIAAVQMFVPFIHSVFGLELSLWGLSNTAPYAVWSQLALCLLGVIVLSGIYPALALSKFSVVEVLKGVVTKGQKGMVFRNVLIVVQFIVTGFFITTIAVVSKQLYFMQERNKGFNEAQVMRLEVPQNIREEGFDNLKDKLTALAGVEYVSKTTQVPGDKLTDSTTTTFVVDGSKKRFTSVKVSTDYFKTLGVGIIDGRDFNNRVADQKTQNVILNESAAKRIAAQSVLGKTVFYEGCEIPMRIIGVVNDFNVMGLETPIQPTAFNIGNEACRYQSGGAVLIKLNTGNPKTVIASIEEVWKELVPTVPIRYSFLDANFESLLITYFRLQKVIVFFGAIAILISLIGLFSLTTFLTHRRTKEIGIRRILGANVMAITTLVGKDFLILVGIATLMAIPVGWWAIRQWMQSFAYQVEIGPGLYGLVFIGILTMTCITVGFQAIRAAKIDPVKSLRTE